MTLFDYIKQNNRFDLLLEWDPEANKGIDPSELAPSSRERFGWVCEKGHHWRAMLAARTEKGNACPYCSGVKAAPGETDLATLRPDLLELWHPMRNGKLTPQQVMPTSHKRVWWRCAHGHEWEARVDAVADGSRCPYCARYKAAPGETDLAASHPELLKEWDYEKNKLTPQEVLSGTRKKVWWKCPEGHSYQAFVYAKTAGAGCPYCSGRKVLPGFNDLATTDPELAAEWDDEANNVKPTEISRSSHGKVWWRCEQGHAYEAAPYSRAGGSGCPYCAGRKVLPGFNDLATTHPKVAAQWDDNLNIGLTPEMVSKGSNEKVWWKCSEGHVWQAAVFSRTRKKASDCPICAGNNAAAKRYKKLEPIRIAEAKERELRRIAARKQPEADQPRQRGSANSIYTRPGNTP